MPRYFRAVSDSSNTISLFAKAKLIKLTHSGALTDYQYYETFDYEPAMLDNFDDIRFTTQSGEHIPYWIETKTDGVSAKVWFMNDYVDGDTYIWMYYGSEGLSAGSNGSDVFVGFFDGDSADWTEVDPNSHLSFVNNRLEFTGLGRNEDAYVYQIASENNNIIIESSYQVTSGDSQSIVLIGAVGDIIDDFANMDNGYTLLHGVSTSLSYAWIRLSDANYLSTGVAPALNTNYFSRTVRTGNTVTCYWYTDSARTNLAYSTSKTQATIPTDLGYLYLMSSWNSAGALYLTGWVDDFRVRKYTAVEPTVAVGAEQHPKTGDMMIL